jgi:hypothetical protein
LVEATFLALTPTVTASPSPTPETVQSTPLPTATSTLVPTPLPQLVRLEGVKYEDQHNRWNYCGPANLSMSLTFWGWQGNRDVVGKAIKPHDKDKNVMPYEMEGFVDEQAEGIARWCAPVVRSGLLKHMVANGFPVPTEKAIMNMITTVNWVGWAYQYVAGYDDAKVCW